MVRAGAKNYLRVAVATDPNQYGEILRVMRENDGATTFDLRRLLKNSAFKATQLFDEGVSAFYNGLGENEERLAFLQE